MSENDKEIEEYELVEELETTKITRDYLQAGEDCCPWCESENLVKDFRKGIYLCMDCGRSWKIVG